MKKVDQLILIGGGGHCKACIDVIELEGRYQIYGILDIADKVGESVLGYEIIGTESLIEEYIKKGFYFFYFNWTNSYAEYQKRKIYSVEGDGG